MISFDTLFSYVAAEKLNMSLSLDHNGTGARSRWSIEITDYSPTAQAGYEHRMMFNHRGSQQDVIDTTMEWLLQHRRRVREARR